MPEVLVGGLIAQGAKELTVVMIAGGGDDGADRRSAFHRPCPQADLQFCAPRQCRRPPVPGGQAGTGDCAARHVWQKECVPPAPGYRLLHADRRRYDAGRGPRNTRDQRPQLPAGISAARRCGTGRCMAGGSLGQPDVSGKCAKLQSGHGDRPPTLTIAQTRNAVALGDIAPANMHHAGHLRETCAACAA